MIIRNDLPKFMEKLKEAVNDPRMRGETMTTRIDGINGKDLTTDKEPTSKLNTTRAEKVKATCGAHIGFQGPCRLPLDHVGDHSGRTENGWTPGPWHDEPENNYVPAQVWQEGRHLADVYGETTDTRKANARLMAQAPAMAELLQVLVNIYQTKQTIPHPMGGVVFEAERILAQIKRGDAR